MKRMVVLCLLLPILTACCAPTSGEAQVQLCLDFLASYGIAVDPHPIEETVLQLPDSPTPVYEQYQALLEKDGFTLSPYWGKQVTRLTFSVINYPHREDVRANCLLYGANFIGGDISTVALDGFMESFSDFP